MPVMELIEQWRRMASHASSPVSVISLKRAADELEQAWHEDEHDAEWRPEICRICVKEMKEQSG